MDKPHAIKSIYRSMSGPAPYRSGLLDIYKRHQAIAVSPQVGLSLSQPLCWCWQQGKGSTSAIIASIMQAAGYKTGLFTGPILDFCERVRINWQKIPEREFVRLTEK